VDTKTKKLAILSAKTEKPILKVTKNRKTEKTQCPLRQAFIDAMGKKCADLKNKFLF